MYNHADKQEDKEKSYIELDSTETEIIKYLNDNYKDVILLVKSSAAMELDWLKQYPNIKAVVYSQNVTNALAKVFSGEVNPSGRTVDKDSIMDTPTFGKKNGLKVSDMRGLAYDDAQWDKILDELTEDDYNQLIYFSGYGVDYIKSVDKPFQTDADSATGWMYGGTGKTFPSIMMLTQTWNAQLAEDLGEMMGNEALLGGANGWYAPA